MGEDGSIFETIQREGEKSPANSESDSKSKPSDIQFQKENMSPHERLIQFMRFDFDEMRDTSDNQNDVADDEYDLLSKTQSWLRQYYNRVSKYKKNAKIISLVYGVSLIPIIYNISVTISTGNDGASLTTGIAFLTAGICYVVSILLMIEFDEFYKPQVTTVNGKKRHRCSKCHILYPKKKMKDHHNGHTQECKVLHAACDLNPIFDKHIVEIGGNSFAPNINWGLSLMGWIVFLLFMPFFFRPDFNETIRLLKEQGD